MKKRMKLTEKELAIGMWLYIKLIIKEYNEYTPTFITCVKYHYLTEHDCCDVWLNDCILCDIYPNCKVCPLHTCYMRQSGLYQKACGFTLSNYHDASKISHKYCRKTRMKACDKIIEIIQKYVPDDYDHVSNVLDPSSEIYYSL